MLDELAGNDDLDAVGFLLAEPRIGPVALDDPAVGPGDDALRSQPIRAVHADDLAGDCGNPAMKPVVRLLLRQRRLVQAADVEHGLAAAKRGDEADALDRA